MKIKKKANAVRIPPLQNAIKVKRKSSEDEEESMVRTALETVKKVIEKKNAKWEVTDSVPIHEKNVAPIREHKRQRTIRKPVKRTNGVVYVGHIPHGFYEEEMEGYFKQFGKVTRVRLVRSKNTGKSRGYGYVEFEFPQVARIAAETMNNYLMCGRLLKATYIPPEKLHKGFFIGKEWSQKEFPKLRNRNRINRRRNTKLSEKEHASFLQSTVTKLSSLEKKLKDKGFNIKFKPVKDTTS